MKSNWVVLASAALLLAFGILVIHGPELADGFAYLHGNLGDARFVHLVLEHGYRVAFGLSRDELWSPSWTMYPLQNALSFSEVLIGSLPLYALPRLLGTSEAAASQIWSVACSVLNFAAAALLLRRLRLDPHAVLLGAFVFAFSLARSTHGVMHTQLLPAFPTPLAAYAALRFFQGEGLPGRQRTGWLVAAGAALVWQVACSVYLAWFAVLAVTVSVVGALAMPSLRPKLLARLREDWSALLKAVVLAFVALWPIASHYLDARSLAGGRSWGSLELPTLSSFLNPQPKSWLYGWIDHRVIAHALGEQRGWIFPGLAPLIAAAVMLATRRKWRGALTPAQGHAVTLALVVAVVMPLLALDFGRGITLWHAVYHFFPGANAIRAAHRVGLFVLLPLAVVLAAAFHIALTRARAEAPSSRPRLALVAALGLLAVVEQGQWYPFRYSIAHHAQRVDPLIAAVTSHTPPCALFAFKDRKGGHPTQLDAMWASLETGVPTVNGGIGTDYAPWSHLWEMEQVTRAGVLRWLEAMGASLPPGDRVLCIFARDAQGRIDDVSEI